MTVVVFMLENSTIETKLKYSENTSDNESMKFLDLEKISGSKSHKTRTDFEEILVKTVHNEENDSLKKEAIYSNLYKFISENRESEMCTEFLYDLSAYYNLLSADQMESLLKMTDISFQKKNDIERISKLIKQRKLFVIGNEPPDLTLPNIEDELVNVKSFNGKIVLLEFWASWCLPCRSTNPELLKIYNDYNHIGFEIIGISIDENKSDWKLAIEQDNLIWPQTIDSLRTTADSYSLNSIPFNLLLNKKGKIIALDIKPDKLNEILGIEL
jgi:thiol-disulfide isomerase/thioredoxin